MRSISWGSDCQSNGDLALPDHLIEFQWMFTQPMGFFGWLGAARRPKNVNGLHSLLDFLKINQETMPLAMLRRFSDLPVLRRFGW